MKKVALIRGVTEQVGANPSELVLAKGYAVHGLRPRSSSFKRSRSFSVNTRRIDHLCRDPREEPVDCFLHCDELTDSPDVNPVIHQSQPKEIFNLAARALVATADLPRSQRARSVAQAVQR